MNGTRTGRKDAAGRPGGRVLVVGSINIDLVTRVREFPQPGETLLGSDYQTHHGGKGANQAVAAARMGADVAFVGRVGSDAFGNRLRQALADEGIDVSSLHTVDAPSGVAFITVDQEGQNTIIVAPGANARITPEDLSRELFEGASVVLLQLEIPLRTVRRAITLGLEAGAQVIVNAAPAGAMSLDDLPDASLLVVNEPEAATLLGSTESADPRATLEDLATRVRRVVMTLGSRGVVWQAHGESGALPPFEVDAVDTTAAGDAFVGALAARLAAGADLAEAVTWGNAAGALAVTRAGAQPSLPLEREVMEMLGPERAS